MPVVAPTVAKAAAAFLATCAASTHRSYTQTMTRLTAAHGIAPVTALDATAFGGPARHALGHRGAGDLEPAPGHSRLVHRLRRPPALARRRPGRRVQRRKETVDRTRAIDPAALQRLFDLPDVRLRERTLWRMLFETAARAEEILTWTSATWTWTTSAPGSAPRAARSSTCTGRPAPPGCSHV